MYNLCMSKPTTKNHSSVVKKKRFFVSITAFALILAIVISLYIARDYFLSYIVAGHENNPVCKSHALIASHDTYEIPAAATA